MAQTITYWDAWALWFSGKEVPADAYLGWLTILVWGRIGKGVAFIAGLTVILDLAGPERLRALGAKQRRDPVARRRTVNLSSVVQLAIAFAVSWLVSQPFLIANQRLRSTDVAAYVAASVLTFIVFASVSYLLTRLAVRLSQRVPALLAEFLDSTRPGQQLRYVALVLLLIGFHLDLLAS